MKKEILQEYIFTGFGFPVRLKNVTMITDNSYTYADIEDHKLEKKVLLKLAKSDQALTGAQLKYIRQFLEYTIRDFANLLGVTHPTIIKWQEKRQERTGMNYSTEILVKSALLIRLTKNEANFFTEYSKIIAMHGERKKPSIYITI